MVQPGLLAEKGLPSSTRAFHRERHTEYGARGDSMPLRGELEEADDARRSQRCQKMTADGRSRYD